MSKVFLASVQNNNLHFSEGTLARLHDDMKGHPKAIYRVERVERIRTDSMNKRYWAYLHDVELETGNIATEIHEIAKRKFLKPKFVKVEIEGKIEEMRIPGTTTDQTTIEFMDYMDKLVAWTGIPQRTAEQLGLTPMNER